MTEIAGKAAVVTGGGSGIGRALAEALAMQGARVVIADILEPNAQSVAGEITRAGGTALAVGCDVSDRESVRSLKARANETLGTISLVFANAGATSVDRLTDLSDDDFDWITQVNFQGVSNCLRVFLPDMIAMRSGHVAATASIVGLIPPFLPRHAAYVAAKAGVIGMMLNLREELSECGVGCTVLCPSGVATRIGDTPRYRPARFGGPFERSLGGPRSFTQTHDLVFRPPAEVAEMLLLGVRENRPMVVTDASQREDFVSGYVDVVLSAFQDCAAYDHKKGAAPLPKSR